MSVKKKKHDDVILSIDAGTQSIRAAIIDLRGNIRDIVKTPIEPYFSKHPGWAEQDPGYYWKTLKTTCKKLMKEMSCSIESIRGVALTTQRNTMINLDANGDHLRPAIVWLDQRKADTRGMLSLPVQAVLKVINMHESAITFMQDCRSNWIQQNQPDIWEKTYKYLFLSGFFSFKLTGEYTYSSANQVGHVPFDYKQHEWAKSIDLKWKFFPLDPGKLPDLKKPAEILGYITKKSSRETGIPAGLPVFAAATDKACEVLGSGCLTPETACLSYGTTATVETTNNKYVEVIPWLPSYPSAVPGNYNTEIMINRGYWMVSWFKKEFCLRETQIADKRGIAPEKLFDELIRDIPPGSMGLTLQPYWSPGIKLPGSEAKGAIIGFGDVHTRAHIYRSILEGLAYALKDGLIKTQKSNNVKIEKIKVSGGGSQSDVAMQITADIFGIHAERPHTYETSALGAAMDAAVGLRMYPDFVSAVRGMTRTRDSFEPIPQNRDIYRTLFEKVYTRMYQQLKPLYNEIREITGYPPKIIDKD